MQKIVINPTVSFNLSQRALSRLQELGSPYVVKDDYDRMPGQERDLRLTSVCDSVGDIPRDDPLLIQVVEELGVKDATYWHYPIKIVEIPDGVKWVVKGPYEEMCGTKEWIEEVHRTWN